MSVGASNQSAAALKALGPGWRCEACDYSLEGLANRDEETQCPECGHVGMPAGSPPRGSRAAIVFSILLSLGSLAASGYAAWGAWVLKHTSEEGMWIAIGLAAGWAIVAIVVWGAVDGRWAVARWVAAIVPGLCAAWGAWATESARDLITIAWLALGVICLAWLINPELGRWLRLPRRKRH